MGIVLIILIIIVEVIICYIFWDSGKYKGREEAFEEAQKEILEEMIEKAEVTGEETYILHYAKVKLKELSNK